MVTASIPRLVWVRKCSFCFSKAPSHPSGVLSPLCTSQCSSEQLNESSCGPQLSPSSASSPLAPCLMNSSHSGSLTPQFCPFCSRRLPTAAWVLFSCFRRQATSWGSHYFVPSLSGMTVPHCLIQYLENHIIYFVSWFASDRNVCYSVRMGNKSLELLFRSVVLILSRYSTIATRVSSAQFQLMLKALWICWNQWIINISQDGWVWTVKILISPIPLVLDDNLQGNVKDVDNHKYISISISTTA